MNRWLHAPFVLFLCFLLLPKSTEAQGTSAASITGVVRDTSGGVLPGVTVEAASPALIEKARSTVTDDAGVYRITELRPGTYTVTFTMPGFAVAIREGLELTSNFTASVNMDLRVGALEETVMVSGETPLVDVQNVTQQTVVSKAILEGLPTSRTIVSLANLMPSAVVPPSFTDVGGAQGESVTRISVHGSKFNDQKQLLDGMRVSSLQASGSSRSHINSLAVQEIVMDAGGAGSAEYATAGVAVNTIPKDGANRFFGSFFTSYMNDGMQADNLTEELQAQGLNSVNGIVNSFDVNGAVGGPVVQNRLWFITSHRKWGREQAIPDLYEDANLDDWVFTPDLSKPVEAPEDNRESSARLTWQATSKDKITGNYSWQYYYSSNNQGRLARTNTAWEQKGNAYCSDMRISQVTWVRPQSSRVLYEAGLTDFSHNVDQVTPDHLPSHCDTNPGRVSITEQNLAFAPTLWHGTGTKSETLDAHWNGRGSMSYVTGSHSFKVGTFFMNAKAVTPIAIREPLDAGGLPLAYRFNSGVPNQLTQYVSPLPTDSRMTEIAVFAQDRWTMNRFTLNYGLRFDYMHQYAPAIVIPPGTLSDGGSFPEKNCIPCWKDLNPRLSAAYDLFGNGKTAIKATFSKYSSATTNRDWAQQFGPAAAAVTSTTRSWSDGNRNFFPDCDLRNTELNGECGPMANKSFGTSVTRTRPDEDWINGWGQRGYVWQSSVSVEHQLAPGTALSAGYFRTTYGNQTVTDNVLVTPADFNPYCVTAPIDPKLGDVAGSQVCGLYNLNPTKFGLVDNIVTLAKNFGDYREEYTGVDISGQARLPYGAQVSGGVSIGNAIGSGAGYLGLVNVATESCFVVDSPQQLYNCESENPHRVNFRMNGTVPMPWGFQAAVIFQSLPGNVYNATATFSNAQIIPSLGRPLSGNESNATVDLFAVGSQFLDERVTTLDLRISNKFRIAWGAFQINADIYNLFNGSTPTNVNSTYGTTGEAWLRPVNVLEGRTLRIGVQADF